MNVIRILLSVSVLWVAVLYAAIDSTSQLSVTDRLKSKISTSIEEGVEVRIESLHVPAGVPETATIGNILSQPPIGLVNFEIQWMDNGRLQRKTGSATVRAFSTVVIAKRKILHKEVLTPESVKLERREVTQRRLNGFFNSLDHVTGMKAYGMILQGDVLGSNNTIAEKPVNSGQVVDLVYQKGNLKITGKVKALQSGELAQWISVQNPKTRRVFQAKIVGNAEVATR